MPAKVSIPRKRKTPTPEALVSGGVREYLSRIGASLGIWWGKMPVLKGRFNGGYIDVGTKGQADLLASVPIKGERGCWLLWIETKAGKKYGQTPEQKIFESLIKTTPGHDYIIAYSSVDVENWLKAKGIIR